jgi:hypothetical protein
VVRSPVRASYAGFVDGASGWRRLSPLRWSGEFGNWRERRAERLAGSPEERLDLAEARLATSLEHRGTDSWRSINAMEAVAKFREGVGRFSDALPLREQVVALRRTSLGKDHQLTLAAEARLGVTLIELDRPGEAKPLLTHVLSGLTAARGPDDLTVLAVTERLADVELALGASEDARALLEQEMANYEGRGDELLAAGVATKIAKVLITSGEYSEAADVLRSVVTVRSRALGPDDPATLASLRNFASSLVWAKEFAEASIVARNVLAAELRINGPEHSDTLDAERLVEDITRRLASD